MRPPGALTTTNSRKMQTGPLITNALNTDKWREEFGPAQLAQRQHHREAEGGNLPPISPREELQADTLMIYGQREAARRICPLVMISGGLTGWQEPQGKRMGAEDRMLWGGL